MRQDSNELILSACEGLPAAMIEPDGVITALAEPKNKGPEHPEPF